MVITLTLVQLLATSPPTLTDKLTGLVACDFEEDFCKALKQNYWTAEVFKRNYYIAIYYYIKTSYLLSFLLFLLWTENSTVNESVTATTCISALP